jgi:two-component system phosphate regulon response regulator PhoB
VAKIVAIDPDPRAREQYVTALARDGHEVHTSATGATGLEALKSLSPDIVVMELVQADIEGTELLRNIRRGSYARVIPVMIVSTRADEIDRIVAFELGADDYLTKPYSTREFGLRIRALMRRRATAGTGDRNAPNGRVRIDRLAHRVWVDEHEVALSVLEFRILTALHERRSGVHTREDLLEAVWGNESGVSLRSVDAYVKRLRKKLGPARHCIETVRGVGYRLSARAAR